MKSCIFLLTLKLSFLHRRLKCANQSFRLTIGCRVKRGCFQMPNTIPILVVMATMAVANAILS